MPPTPTPYLPTTSAIASPRTGQPTREWLAWFRSTQGSIESLTTSVAGQLSTILQDTHANRLAAYPATDYDPGALFYETDRTVVYRVNAAGTAWVYAAGEMAAAFASVPADLGADDAGFLLQITDYGHRAKWSGTAWGFAPGDPGNAYFADFAVAPSVPGWALCDGSATTYLTMGATITATAFTTPNLAGSPAYRKSAAAYTGTISAATAPGLSGSSGSTAPGMTGETANATATISGDTASATASLSGTSATSTATISGQTATATDTFTTSGPSGSSVGVTIGTDDQAANATHAHDGTTDGHLHGKGTLAVDAHDHGVGTLAVDAHLHAKGTLAVDAHKHALGTLAVDAHTHGVGTYAVDATGEPARLGVLPFFRR